MSSPDWEAHLAALLAGVDGDMVTGAEIEITDADGTTRRWPLARHYRFEACPAGDWVLWLRPLTDDAIDSVHGPEFPHEHARRQALTWTEARREGDDLLFRTPAGQAVRIRRVGHDLVSRLRDWDTFVLTLLPAEVELDLDRLDDDSWG